MNQMETVPHGTFLRSKQTVTVAIEFLNWLHDHGLTLPECRQEHLDAWLADGPSTRRIVDRFLPWAIRPAHPRGKPATAAEGRLQTLVLPDSEP